MLNKKPQPMQEMKNWITVIIALTLTLPLTAQTVEWDVRGPNSTNTNSVNSSLMRVTSTSDYEEAAQAEEQTDDEDAAKKEDESTEEASD